MADYKHVLAAIASILAVISIIPYYWNVIIGHTKPHAFSWLVWSLLTGIAFVAQLISGAGWASLVLGITSISCFTIAIIGFFQGHVKYSRFDWAALSGALIALILWQLTKNPLLAVILVSLSDVIALLPTIRKAYFYPNEETASSFVLGALYFLLSIIALETFIMTNWLYPAVISLGNTTLVFIILVRRRLLKHKEKLSVDYQLRD